MTLYQIQTFIGVVWSKLMPTASQKFEGFFRIVKKLNYCTNVNILFAKHKIGQNL